MAAALCVTREQTTLLHPNNLRGLPKAVAMWDSCCNNNNSNSKSGKRKAMRLDCNADVRVPTRLFHLSLMSTAERLQLCKCLKLELQQVRFQFHKIESKSVSAIAVVSSSTDMPSFGSVQRLENGICNGGAQGKKSSKANELYDKMTQEKPKGKDVGATGIKPGRRLDSSQVVRRRKDDRLRADPIVKNQCGTILRRLMLHKYGYVFNSPVDIVALNVPDYFNVIKKPMDLGSIKQKLESNSYLDPRDFAADVRLTFANALKYNPPGNDVHFMAGLLSEIFESKWRSIIRKLPEVVEPSGHATKGAANKQKQKQKQPFPTSKSKLNNKPTKDTLLKQDACKRPMTTEEKQKLSRDLESLCDMPQQIMDFLKQNSSHLSKNEDEIEVDIDAFNNDTLLQLRKVVTNCLQNNAATNHLKAAPREAEPIIMLRLGNTNCSPVNNIKGDEDDVDIGENDLPVSCCSPVEIEKDKHTVGRSSKGTSYSCSSSESGSSSSDSGSSTSSCNEFDAAPKAPSPDAASPKEARGCDAACNQTSIVSVDTHGVKRAVSGLDEENSHSKPLLADSHHKGESAPTSSERQVSPEKRYRAALLRSRFADTILKAQEKTLSQDDSGDPEKLRREREELERRQREEKARLQAEAKAAEMARMQAEAMAAAEAKRKLEIARGAARLALQQMEKTVEIDENAQVLKDLEMFRTSQADHFPRPGDEISLNNSHDRLEAFPLHGRNPLEQLGLFMKRDEEEEEEMGFLFIKRDEEEVVTSSVPGNGDVEEGEID